VSVWSIASIDDEPDTVLGSWSVFEAEITPGVLTRHLVGYVEFDGGRASSAIQQFDLQSRRAVTASGRVYQLLGKPGYNADAEYTWKCWVPVNSATNVRDVTHELVELASRYLL
jgi:hypothetical protein